MRAVTGGELSPEDVIEMEHGALAETGNVILNSCLGTMANMLQQSIALTIPEVLRGSGASLFDVRDDGEQDRLVLFLYIDFAVRTRDIRGYMAMIMDLPALTTLKELLEEFIERVIVSATWHKSVTASVDYLGVTDSKGLRGKGRSHRFSDPCRRMSIDQVPDYGSPA